ncbi:hypothetical protein OG562_23260 [Streptomyces sp. NBC_01275]|uniref:TRM11 family SAM-dependent methyltransferase n=1 Tax=Streptomyces sp. NBC_01275 TaxID=2903807 RepID=UPI00224D954E|nr:hypothetical protein [Streptomyces sp. NBC_01275]MCX4763833.1 hypothetical protein [Streptomyces sp. NBC_01275]
MRYFIQYPAGTGKLVVDAVSNFVENFSVRYQDDSAMLFDSTSSAERVSLLPFAKNAFVVLADIPRKDVNQSALQLAQRLDKGDFSALRGRVSGFRIMAHVDGELASLAPGVKTGFERAVSANTGGRVEPRGSCQEFWLIGRLDLRDLMFCARLPKRKRPKKARGAVSHELSSMLVLASRPGDQDVFLDPFGGSGSFALSRAEMPARDIVYSDLDLASHRREFPDELIRDKRVRLLSEDALTLTSIPDGSVDVIVTDPPWGEYEELPMPYPEFTQSVSESFARVLRPTTGRFVLMCARRGAADFRQSLEGAGFTIDTTHDILVNGHPATVFVGSSSGTPTAEPSTRRKSAAKDEGAPRAETSHRPDKPLLRGMSTQRRAMSRFSR